MSDELFDELENDSDLVKSLRKQLKERDSKLKEAEAAASAASRKLGERTLSDVLKAKNLSPKIAKFIQSDGVDASDTDAIEAWLGENAEVFGFQANPEPEPDVDPEDVQAYEAMGSAFTASKPPSANKQQAVVDELDKHDDWTPEQILAYVKGSGV